MTTSLDESLAVRTLLELLGIPGLSGQEHAVAEYVRTRLIAAGIPAEAIRHDRAPERIRRALGDAAPKLSIGNLIVTLPGTFRAPRRLCLAHMDTVPLCRDARPVRKGRFIRPAGRTGLGADNRVGVAAWLIVLETIAREKLPHPPLTVAFTVAEEIGLYGAKSLRPTEVGRPAMAFNIDSGEPHRIIVGAIGANKWNATVHGRSSHAGVRPEAGVSAILIASRAIARVAERGYFGKILKGRRKGTANAGVIHGGEATNQVTHLVEVRGECRSHDPRFLAVITREWQRAFEEAARSVRNVEGHSGRVAFEVTSDYKAFRLPDRHPAVRFICAAALSIGLKPETCLMDGGLDANPLNAAGVPTVTFGAGQHKPHSFEEYVDIPEFLDGCRLALALATRR